MAATRGLGVLVTRWQRLPLAVRAAAPVAIMAALWWSSSRSLRPRDPSIVRMLFHNGMHVVAYGALAGAVLLALVRPGLPPARRAARTTASFLIAVAYGLVDELHQSFVGRTCSAADLLTDAVGALLALLFLVPHCGARRPSPAIVLVVGVFCCGSVALATWGPW